VHSQERRFEVERLGAAWARAGLVVIAAVSDEVVDAIGPTDGTRFGPAAMPWHKENTDLEPHIAILPASRHACLARSGLS
jgi:hypothetical protein